MGIKLADTLAPMADFPAAMAEHIEFDDGENLQEKLDNGSLGGGAGYDSFIKLTGTMGYRHYAREFSYSDIQTVFDTGNTNSPGYGLTLEKVESNQTNLITALTRVETIKDKKFTCSGTTSIDLMQNGILHFSSQDFEQPYEMLIEWNEPIIDDNQISTETTWSSEKILIETAENYAIFEGVIGDSYYSTNIGNDDITSTPASLYGGWTLDTVTSNGDIESILSNYNSATTKRVISFSDILSVYDISDTSITLEDTTKDGGGQPYKFILVWENDSKESGSKTYTSLDELGLTADAAFQDVVDVLPEGGSALLGVTEFTNYQTIFPYEEGNDQFARVYIVKGTADGSRMYARWFRKDGVKEAIAIFNIDDNKFDGWRILKDQQIYTSLKDLGLDTTATINDIIGAMTNGSVFTYKTDVFDYATEYNNIQNGTVTIHKQSESRVQVLMTDKNTGNLYVGRMDTSNRIVGWRNDAFHRIVTQATSGYFKFKPTSDGGFDQSLRISVTDNYGGMINISGAKPSASQYKPFKCIRLSNGTYTDYDAIKTTNNKMEKLYFYDGYFYLKVVAYTTCTFTGLLEVPTYIETFDETVAEEIPIRSVFDTPYNDGYADPSIIAIGDANSSDGVIKTLGTLGFTGDIMTWYTGEYRISHVGGLTNLPTEITEEKPGFRLAHYDVKKWGSNHNPYVSTYGCRQSVLHYKGNIFVRYTESGANAGVLITDTGWQKVGKENTKALVTNAQNFKLDITKNNAAWYGFFTFNFMYGVTPCEISFTISDKVYYTITKGQNVVSAITYTQSDANYQIGIDFTTKMYGTQVVEMPSEFGTINSLTDESYAGTTNATLKLISSRTYTTLAELGLTASATVENVIAALPIGGKALISTHEFTNYQTLFPYSVEADQFATLNVEKGYDTTGSRTIVTWVRKDASRIVYGGLDSTNAVKWWNEVAMKESFNGKPVKTLIIDLSASDLQSTGSSSAWVSLGNYISQTTKVIRAEGYYNPPSDSTYPVVIPVVFGSQAGHLTTDSTGYSFRAVQSPSGNKGSGFVKIYYIE